MHWLRQHMHVITLSDNSFWMPYTGGWVGLGSWGMVNTERGSCEMGLLTSDWATCKYLTGTCNEIVSCY